MTKPNGTTSTQFDFSHLSKTETVEIMFNGAVAFTAIVREIPHGAKADAQRMMMASLDLSIKGMNKGQIDSALSRSMEKGLKSGNLDITASSDMEAVAAIQSWTLKNKEGDDIPVCLEAWRALTHNITEQIEAAIERLNPEMDENFSD